jgi:Flp pilus assembly protein TadB
MTAGQQRDESRSRGQGLLAPLHWLGRKLSGLVRWVAKRLRAPLRPIARLLMLRWVANHLPAPLRWLGRLVAPGGEHGFGFWWLVATLGVAIALGILVALLLAPVAGLIALLVVAIWVLVRRRRRKRDDRDAPIPAARPL